VPLLPIDLQTIFAQMNEVGRGEAAQRQVAPEAQALQASQIVRQTEERDNSVNESQQVSEGPEAIKEEEQRGERRGAAERERRKKKSAESQAEAEVFKDPDLGHHIDVTR
jgi:hypothetical protein